MATHGARRTLSMVGNTRQIFAIGLLSACQGLDFRKSHRTSSLRQRAHAAMRQRVPFATEDRLLADDIAAAAKVLRTPAIQDLARSLLASNA